MALKRIVAPSTQCVSVADVKEFLRIQSTSEDYLLRSMIKVAESYAENYMKRSINRQQWELRIDNFDQVQQNYEYNGVKYYHYNQVQLQRGDIELPRPPLTTASSEVVVTYIEDTTAGATTSIASSALTIDYYSEPGVIYPSYDNEWPTPRDVPNAVRITYYSGYSTPSNVPEPIKQWVKLRVGAMYENRESLLVGSGNFVTELPHNYIDGLLDEFVVQSV